MAMIFQEPMTSLNPAYTIGNQLEEACLRHRRTAPAQGARDRAAATCSTRRHHRRRRAGSAVPAPAVGRAAPARDDRHGADVRPHPDHRGRTDHGARRHHPGGDPAPAGGAAARVRHGAGPDHARSRHRRAHRRPRGGDVRGPGGRGRPGGRIFAAPAHPYTQGLLACIPVPGRTRRGDHLGTIPGSCRPWWARCAAAISPAAVRT